MQQRKSSEPSRCSVAENHLTMIRERDGHRSPVVAAVAAPVVSVDRAAIRVVGFQVRHEAAAAHPGKQKVISLLPNVRRPGKGFLSNAKKLTKCPWEDSP